MTSLGSTRTRAFLRLLTSIGTTKTQDTLKLLPFVVMAVVALIDFGSGPTSGLLPLLALGPAFASVACGLARTTVVGVVALVLVEIEKRHANIFKHKHLFRILL
jgi:hypothetical protein